MIPVLSQIRQAIDGLTEVVGRSAALLVIPLALITTWEVGSRYLLGRPTSWAFELGFMLMGVHFLLAGPYALRHNFHVRIDLIYARFSPRGRAMLDLVLWAGLVAPALWLIIDRFGAFALRSFETGERSGASSWNPPIWPFRALIVAAFTLLLLQVTATIIRCLEVLFGFRPRYPEE